MGPFFTTYSQVLGAQFSKWERSAQSMARKNLYQTSNWTNSFCKHSASGSKWDHFRKGPHIWSSETMMSNLQFLGGEVCHRRHQLKRPYCVIKRRNTDPSGTRKWCQRGRSSTPRMGMLFFGGGGGVLQFSTPYFSNALKQPTRHVWWSCNILQRFPWKSKPTKLWKSW